MPFPSEFSFDSCRLEALNERRSGVVQMVKLAEKERDSLEVHFQMSVCVFFLTMYQSLKKCIMFLVGCKE